MKISHWIVAGVLATSPLAARAETPDTESHPREKVTMDELPAPVKTTVQREARGKKVESMTKEQKDGKTVYEIELVSNGKGQEIEISDTGKVLARHARHEEKTEAEHEKRD